MPCNPEYGAVRACDAVVAVAALPVVFWFHVGTVPCSPEYGDVKACDAVNAEVANDADTAFRIYDAVVAKSARDDDTAFRIYDAVTACDEVAFKLPDMRNDPVIECISVIILPIATPVGRT